MAEREVGRNEQTNAKEFDVAAVPREEKGRSSFVGRKNMESLSRDRPVAGGVKVHPDYWFSYWLGWIKGGACVGSLSTLHGVKRPGVDDSIKACSRSNDRYRKPKAKPLGFPLPSLIYCNTA